MVHFFFLFSSLVILGQLLQSCYPCPKYLICGNLPFPQFMASALLEHPAIFTHRAWTSLTPYWP